MLVEDSASDAALFQAMAKSSERLRDATFVWVRGIAQAREALASTPVDCVLLDLGLPDAEGLSGLLALRQASEHVAIVVLTGLDDDTSAMAAVRGGAQDYLIKESVQPGSLARTILHAIHRQQFMVQLAKRQNDAHYLATHDELTGLANRRFLEDPANIQHAKGLDTAHALIVIDLDRFKAVNDDKGHAAGDEVLKAVAQRLQLCTRDGDVAVRLGGDEFVLILAAQLDARAEAELVLRLRNAIAEPIDLGTHCLNVSASIGIARSPSDGTTLNQLLLLADRRMYEDKMQRRIRRP